MKPLANDGGMRENGNAGELRYTEQPTTTDMPAFTCGCRRRATKRVGPANRNSGSLNCQGHNTTITTAAAGIALLPESIYRPLQNGPTLHVRMLI